MKTKAIIGNMKVKAIIRLMIMIVLTVNAGLTLAGINPIPFDESAFTEAATQVAAGISIVWSWWKNANITEAAQYSQTILKAVKEDGLVIEDEDGEENEDTKENQ